MDENQTKPNRKTYMDVFVFDGQLAVKIMNDDHVSKENMQQLQ